MQKILLYYKFVPVADPEAVRLWQRTLAENLQLKGRILIAEHGINGTVGGEIDDLKAYIRATKQHPAFKGMEFKWSDGSRDDFPKLIVKVRPEIVTFGVADKIRVDNNGIKGGGKRLKPQQLHSLIEQRGEDIVFFDGRNAYEAAVGKFKGAVVPRIEHSRDFQKELQKPNYKKLKNKTIVTYCTGGIRCEVLTMLMKEEGFQDVYQLDGGIVKYGQTYGDDGLWEGSLYVFDDRITTQFSENAKDIGICYYCHKPTSVYTNCTNPTCNKRLLVCKDCASVQQHCKEDQTRRESPEPKQARRDRVA